MVFDVKNDSLLGTFTGAVLEEAAGVTPVQGAKFFPDGAVEKISYDKHTTAPTSKAAFTLS